ncbi:MAG: transcriptional repressor LexA [SAR202 cluster bacterium]|nr:transcriptional repressor LexA [SAR202 cluster bacterium]|tara:strand:- start:7541 stop:8188 length:648 start_codon:yes stop_codon:yes gene_type:complete
MVKLSSRQQQILDFLNDFHVDKSYMPSVREIQMACGISSTSVVDYNLRLLERDGYIRRSPDISRAIELVQEKEVDLVEVAMIPIMGTIAAGQPIPVPEASSYDRSDLDKIALSPHLTPHHPEDLFALRVKGFSMIDAFITDGDIVVLRPTTDARDGDMVAAWLPFEEEATLKHFYLEGNQVRLMPANKEMDPIVVPADRVQVHGRVVAVMRKMAN